MKPQDGINSDFVDEQHEKVRSTMIIYCSTPNRFSADFFTLTTATESQRSDVLYAQVFSVKTDESPQ